MQDVYPLEIGMPKEFNVQYKQVDAVLFPNTVLFLDIIIVKFKQKFPVNL